MRLEPGAAAPPFELTSDAGDRVTLSSFEGQRVVLFFFSKAGTSG
jgi:peroxiredoxin